jgi:preprotein translocase subunit Sec61beta
MSIDFKTFNTIAPLVANSRLPILLRGRHGIGKSQVVYQLATSLERPVVERRASQMTEGDLVGLPDNTDKEIGGMRATTFNPPDWFLTAVAEPVVLFFDEVDRAVPEVRQGLFELMDSRKLNGITIHPDTVVIAAINGGEHGSQYQVHEMDPAELDRYTVFDVEPTVEDWLAWGKDNVTDPIWDFINNNRSHLEHTGDFEPNKVYPSRRSWDRLNSTADAAGLLKPEGNLDNLFTLATAFVGFEAAVSLRDFVANYTKVVTPEMIIDDGNIAATKDFGINDHCALIEKMEAAGSVKEELSGDQLGNLADYFKSLPSEAAMKLWSVVGQVSEKNAIGLHGLSSDFLIKMLAGDNS